MMYGEASSLFSNIPPGALGRKLSRLVDIIKNLESGVVAFSGGVDSTFLLYVASCVLRERVLGVTARSETYPRAEIDSAVRLAQEIGVNHLLIESRELDNENFVSNPPERCYYCKKELYRDLWELARGRGYEQVLDGSNVDDLQDYRPGMRAVGEMEAISPLQEAGLTKEEIRQLSRFYHLPTADKPSMACLSSRFPYGRRITRDQLKQVEHAEEYLRNLNLGQLRVRHHGELARIEVGEEDILSLIYVRESVVKRFKELGFIYITLDLEGFRSGSMNEML